MFHQHRQKKVIIIYLYIHSYYYISYSSNNSLTNILYIAIHIIFVSLLNYSAYIMKKSVAYVGFWTLLQDLRKSVYMNSVQDYRGSLYEKVGSFIRRTKYLLTAGSCHGKALLGKLTAGDIAQNAADQG